jgi:L-ascorbate metabolism protein UlaG (beta-lactamase superfamily)
MLTFQSTLNITHIGTATAIIEIDGINQLTDPVFRDAGADIPSECSRSKAQRVPQLSSAIYQPIDAVLLSHEDHPETLQLTVEQHSK